MIMSKTGSENLQDRPQVRFISSLNEPRASIEGSITSTGPGSLSSLNATCSGASMAHLSIVNIPIHFCRFTHKATQPPSSFIPATGTIMQVCIPEVQCHPQNFFLLHPDALVLHPLYDQVMYVLHSVCKMHDFPSVSIRLPLYLFSIAGNGLLIYSHQLFFVRVKAIFILKSGSFFLYITCQTTNVILTSCWEKFHFFL